MLGGSADSRRIPIRTAGPPPADHVHARAATYRSFARRVLVADTAHVRPRWSRG